MLNRFLITIIISYFSIVLTTSSPFHDSNLFQDKMNVPVNHNVQVVYAEEDDDDNDKDDKDDDDDDDNDKDDEENRNKPLLDERGTPVANMVSNADESLLSFNRVVSNTSTSHQPTENQIVKSTSHQPTENFLKK